MTPAPAPPEPQASVWDEACLIAALVAIDPAGLGGVSLRGGPGPVRERWLAQFRAMLPREAPVRRIPLNVADDRLLGGLDLAASLSAGRAVAQRGVLADCDGGIVILAMAERIEVATMGRLAAVLDRGEVAIEREGLAQRWAARVGVVALDEGVAPEERPPNALLERLAFRIDLEGVSPRACRGGSLGEDAIAAARWTLAVQRPTPDAAIQALCKAAGTCGASSLRGPLLALRAAAAHAALNGRFEIASEDLAAAARLVLAPRATQWLQDAPAPRDQPGSGSGSGSGPEPEQSPSSAPSEPQTMEAHDAEPEASEAARQSDIAVGAVQAALPQALLDGVQSAALARLRPLRTRGDGAGAVSAQRGRPIGSRPGALRPGDRLDLPQTLRAAAPWQRLRRQAPTPEACGGAQTLAPALKPANDAARLRIRPEDFRIRRFVQKSQSTTIFVVDASGSAALNRLGEAKGAVELLLAKAYVSRTRVALIAFAGRDAPVLLAPTRSLTRAKRQLCDLAGGGGTPLASAIDAALALALAERAKDRTPRLVFLTDGRANLGRDGAPGRPVAERHALDAAAQVRNSGVNVIFMDTSARPQPNGDRYALAMGGIYAPLPYVDASAVFGLVDSLDAGRRGAP